MRKKTFFSFLTNTKTMVYLSMLIAVYAVLSIFNIYFSQQLRFGFTFIPLAFASMLFGPVAGGITGAFGDILGWIITHPGPYIPGLTISAFVSGIIYGIFLYKKDLTITRALLAAVTTIIVVELGLNSIWFSILYGDAYFVVLGGRLLKALILVPVQTIVFYGMRFLRNRIEDNIRQ